ncbi:hypothetical protein LOC71_07565 [Rhodopirellula sp. JC740]|uniref:Uncharacterized protein n=1 Tax=Rhodopirellula halodulae TaxID=2894198 RepID=A0ABS8NGQ3_9BACT|nr:hypothetical protein [Rhodopirellula sp. JC740]MCC9642127.1 hypothetical protein [Rhodopirellula sp. JC740]
MEMDTDSDLISVSVANRRAGRSLPDATSSYPLGEANDKPFLNRSHE